MKQILAIVLIAILSCRGQTDQKFNLGFENQKAGSTLSEGWTNWGTYGLSIDSVGYSGTKSGKITSDSLGSSFGSMAYKIPANYEGESIKLEGFMKIRSVENGFAGLLLRIDGNGEVLSFDNMESQKVTGSRDWQKYSITLDHPDGAENIYVAGILVGKGEAWFDDFVLSVDGENVQYLKEVNRTLPKAQLDKEFDSGSSIEIPDLTASTIYNLDLLGKVWGFLKYHHPEIAHGNYNWDYELFRLLPQYLHLEDDTTRDELIIDWIDALGELHQCSTCLPTSEDAVISPDFRWIKEQRKSLREKLLSVYDRRTQGKHYYIGMAPNIGNPIFKSEQAYPQMAYPDDGFRLLSLFRYWNMINYFFPYKHLTDRDWSLVLSEYVPIFLNARDELEYQLAAIQLFGEIKDTHANLWSQAYKVDEWKGNKYPPFHVGFVEGQLVVTEYYKSQSISELGLKVGDVIKKINGRAINEIIEERSKYYPASNVPTRLRDMSSDLLRSNEREIRIHYVSYDSNEQITDLQLYRKNNVGIFGYNLKSDEKSYRMLDNNIGYVTLESIKEEDIPKIKEEFREARGIIVDIRNYPSTFVPFSLGSYFVSSATPFVKFSSGNIDNPGEFKFVNELEIPSRGETYEGKLVVLVNASTQSQAEYTAMAFRAGDNTTIIGSTTAGADGNVTTLFLPGGLRTMISGIGVYYPNGEETQRVGIVPDIVVERTIEGIRMGKDELLERAIEVILKS